MSTWQRSLHLELNFDLSKWRVRPGTYKTHEREYVNGYNLFFHQRVLIPNRTNHVAVDTYGIIPRYFLPLASTSPGRGFFSQVSSANRDPRVLIVWMGLPSTFGSDGIRVDLRTSSPSRSLLFPSFSPLPSLPTLFRLSLILSMNLLGCRWWAEIRGLLKLNPCTSSCSPRAGRPVRPEATHQERLIAEKITLLNTLPGQCFFSPVATCSPASPSASTNELPLDTDNTAEHLTRGSGTTGLTAEAFLLAKNLRVAFYVSQRRTGSNFAIYFCTGESRGRSYVKRSSSSSKGNWDRILQSCFSFFSFRDERHSYANAIAAQCPPVSVDELRSRLQRGITARLLLYGTPR